MLSRRALTHRTLLLDFLAPSTICRVAPRVSARGSHEGRPAKAPLPVPTPEERNALFNSLRRIVKDRRHNVKLTNTQIDQFHRDLQKWRVGMLDGDLATVVRTLREFKQKKLSGLITQRDWKELSYFVSQALDPARGFDLKDPAWEELAVDAAAADGGGTGEAAFALKKLLLARFRAGKFAGVLELYDRFVAEARTVQADMHNTAASRPRPPGAEGQQPTASKADENAEDVAEDPSQTHTYLQHTPGLLDLHLCALAAHHALGSFEGALRVVVGVQVRFVPSAINNFCRTAYGMLDPHEARERAESFVVFVEQVKTARSVARPKALAQEIKRMQDDHDAQRLVALYEATIAACRASPSWFNTPASSSEELPLRLHEVVWLAFLSAFGTMRMLKNVQAAWEEMRAHGVQPTQNLWNAFLVAHAACGHAQDTLVIWREMVELGTIDIVSYSTMMKAYNTFGLVDDTIKLFDYLQQIKWKTEPGAKGGKPASKESRRRVCNIMLDGLLTRASDEAPATGPAPTDNAYFMRAQALLQEMQTSGPTPDLFTHNAFLLYHARNGDVPGAAGRLRLIAQNGLTPDTASFTIVLQALLRAEHPNASKVVLDLMRAFGVVPETPVYATILGAILGLPGEAHVAEALGVLDEMARSDRARPDERTYSVMLAGLFRQRGLAPERTRELEREVQRRMVAQRINLSQLSYNHIVCACLEPAAQPSELMLDTGLRYYNEMIRRGALPNNKAWMLVLTTLSSGRRKDLGEALELIRTMEEKDVSGDPPLRKLVEKVQREAGTAVTRPLYY